MVEKKKIVQKKIKEVADGLSQTFKTTLKNAITTAISLILMLSWRDLLIEALNSFLPTGLSIYYEALTTTIMCVIILFAISKW
jgi:hypothetical protein